MKNNGEIYPKAPLVEVVFELRFPGEPAVECHRDELFQFVRKSMPLVRVPEATSPEHFKFRTYQYASEDSAFTVMSGINLLLYSSKRYSGYADFTSQLVPIFKFFTQRFKLGPLRRFGFRYINAIPFTRDENGAIPVSKYFRSKFSLSPDIADGMEQCSISVVQKVGPGQVITKVEGLRKPGSGEEAFMLDIDYFRTGDIKAADFESYLEEGHVGAKHFFESIISDQYRDFLRGEPLV